MSAAARQKDPEPSVLSLAQLLEQQPPTATPCLVEPGLLPPQGILFVGGEPKVGKSLLVANLALSLAAGSDRTGFPIPAPRRVLVCQFELPVPQFVSRLATMRRIMGNTAIIHARTAYTKPDGSAGGGRYTDVWMRQNGCWLAVSAHVTRL